VAGLGRKAAVRAIILAAGVARRLAPLTDHTQKPVEPSPWTAVVVHDAL